MSKIWPNFFIVGAAKAGTTTLYEYLNITKGVYMSPVKETRFFHRSKSRYRIIANSITDESKYLKLFSKVKDEKAIGEASPGYLRDPETPELIHEKVPNAKIIIMLRDPVQRAFSHYLMKKTNGLEKPLHQIIEDYMKGKKYDTDSIDRIISAGLYTDNIKRYMNIFGSQNIKILIFEKFVKDPTNHVKEVLNFLGVDSKLPSNIGKVYNAYSEPRGKIAEMVLSNQVIWKIGAKLIPRNSRRGLKKKVFLKDKEKPELSEKDGRLLQKFYKEDVSNLEKLLGRKFPWKWFDGN